MNQPEFIETLRLDGDKVVAISTQHWTWLNMEENPFSHPSKLHTNPDYKTEWLTPAEAREEILKLADGGFIAEGEVGQLFTIICLVPTPKGYLFCTQDGRSFPFRAGRHLLRFNPEKRYYTVDMLTGVCRDVYKKPMQPTANAIKEQQIISAIKSMRSNDTIKHALTLEEVYRIEQVAKTFTPAPNNIIAREINKMLDTNKKAGRPIFTGFDKPRIIRKDNHYVIYQKSKSGNIMLKVLTNVGSDMYMAQPADGDGIIVFYKHFFERFAERNGIDKEDLDIAIELATLEVFSYNWAAFGAVRNRRSALVPMTSGAAFGTSFLTEDGRSITAVKTYVPDSMLQSNQLSALSVLRGLMKRT